MRQEEQLRMGTVTTLDEPISETIMRDVRQITDKLKVVLLPLTKDNEENVIRRLRECKHCTPDVCKVFIYWLKLILLFCFCFFAIVFQGICGVLF